MNTVRVVIKEQVALSIHVIIDRLLKNIVIISRRTSVDDVCYTGMSFIKTGNGFSFFLFASLKQDRIWMNLSFSFSVSFPE